MSAHAAGKCRRTGKLRYPTVGDAAKALQKLAAKGRHERRSYPCRYCQGYHLTSRPIMGAPKRP